jgi:hypothetical protein
VEVEVMFSSSRSRPSALAGPSQGLDEPTALDTQGLFGNQFVQQSLQDQGALGLYEGATSGSGAAVPFLSEMEQLFGQSFADVRAFFDPAAAQALSADAVTDGETIVFSGPPTREVVAHEIAHVVQHRNGARRPRGWTRAAARRARRTRLRQTRWLAGRRW